MAELEADIFYVKGLFVGGVSNYRLEDILDDLNELYLTQEQWPGISYELISEDTDPVGVGDGAGFASHINEADVWREVREKGVTGHIARIKIMHPDAAVVQEAVRDGVENCNMRTFDLIAEDTAPE